MSELLKLHKLQKLHKDLATMQLRCERLKAENQALKEEIESAPVVYGKQLGGKPDLWAQIDKPERMDTHRARLVRIEKLEDK